MQIKPSDELKNIVKNYKPFQETEPMKKKEAPPVFNKWLMIEDSVLILIAAGLALYFNSFFYWI